MQRSILRSSARLILQQSSRRSASSTRVLSNNNNNNRSKWIAVGLTTIGTVGFLMMSNPIMADSEGKKLSKNAEGAKVVTKEVKSSDESTPKEEEATSTPRKEEDQVEANEGDEEQGQQAAYDPVTGEINWDCPCLGGMAHGPCGEEFKEAFSCFVYSELEPKGIDCIEKFKNMQNCFRKYPEVYSEELRDDDNGDDEDRSVEIETGNSDAKANFPEGEEEVIVTVVENDQGNVIADAVVIDEIVNDSFTFDDKVSIDLKDVDEFIRDEPNQN